MTLELARLNLDSEAVLEAAFKHVYNAMVITDADFDGGPFIQRCNPAFCAMTGYAEEELLGQSPRILQGPDTDRKVIDQLKRTIRAGEFFEGTTTNYRKDGAAYVVRWNISPVLDAHGSIVAYISIQQDITERFQAVQRIADSEQQYRLVAENMRDFVAHVRDGRIVWASPSVTGVLGATPDYWIGREARVMVPSEDLSASADHWAILMAGGIVQERVRVVGVDGVVHWVHLHANPFYDADGRQDGVVASLRLIDDEVAAEQNAEEARRQRAKSDERYRRSMETAAIGMALLSPDGTFIEVNPALCQLFGYDAETLTQKTWQELTPPEYLAVGQEARDALFNGQLDSYHVVKQYIHADGHRIWVDAFASGVRDENGRVETLAFQIRDITEQVQADERNRVLNRQVQQQTNLLNHELESAAAYMSSIMPIGLTGKVAAASRYLPSGGVGGDCFDYTWIDGDHLLVYLIDVSGHGIEPALMSVSVHNMIRSGSLANETLRAPGLLLTELNRLFQMDRHRGHYFTMWCGAYEASTRTLRYACAGAPPALAFDYLTGEAPVMTELSTDAVPIGMFEDTVYDSATYCVPPGCRMLIYSDGAYELEPADGWRFALEDFKALAARLARTPNGSIDELVDELRALTPTGGFEDDCSLIGLRFN